MRVISGQNSWGKGMHGRMVGRETRQDVASQMACAAIAGHLALQLHSQVVTIRDIYNIYMCVPEAILLLLSTSTTTETLLIY